MGYKQIINSEINEEKSTKNQQTIVWRNIFLFILLHSSIIYAFYAIIFIKPYKTFFFNNIYGFGAGLGITAGAHRLWSHKAYKAKLPLRIFLATLQTIAGQNNIYEWCRDHRVHHKFSETDADPHNSKRGFFFSHMGWLCMKKHPDVLEYGQKVDCSDLLEDPVVRFQKKYFYPLGFFLWFLIPTAIPCLFWNETLVNSYMIGIARYCISLHVTWLVNSAAHMWGYRPYNSDIGARENEFIALGALGEGFHNYHHTFPWDYSTSELGWKYNFSTMFIDAMAFIGQAYDLRRVPNTIVQSRKNKTKAFSKQT